MMTGFSVSRLDSRIKTLLGYRAQLVGELQRNAPRDGVCDGGNGGDNRAHLPDDCWRHVIGFLVHPRDVLNLGLVNRWGEIIIISEPNHKDRVHVYVVHTLPNC